MKINDFKNPVKKEGSLFNNYQINPILSDQGNLFPGILTSLSSSETSFSNFLNLTNGSSSLSSVQKLAVKLVVSETNQAQQCLAVHVKEAVDLGFSMLEILQIRTGVINFDDQLAALVNYAKLASLGKGHVSGEVLEEFFQAGYSYVNLTDVIMVIAEKTMTNYFFAATGIPITLPVAFEIESEEHFS